MIVFNCIRISDDIGDMVRGIVFIAILSSFRSVHDVGKNCFFMTGL